MTNELVPREPGTPEDIAELVVDLGGLPFGVWWMEVATDDQRRAIVDAHGRDALRRLAIGELTVSAPPASWRGASFPSLFPK